MSLGLALLLNLGEVGVDGGVQHRHFANRRSLRRGLWTPALHQINFLAQSRGGGFRPVGGFDGLPRGAVAQHLDRAHRLYGFRLAVTAGGMVADVQADFHRYPLRASTEVGWKSESSCSRNCSRQISAV
jgi:hypothetical protein